MSDHEHTIDDIVNALIRAKDTEKGAMLLIGAGCSATAGIPLASEVVKIIEERFPREFERAGPAKNYPDVMYHLSPGERRGLISEQVKDAKINWAHICMAQLLKSGYVSRILTTNFDPLIMRACSLLQFHPAVYDFGRLVEYKADHIPSKAVFYLHGQHTGFVLRNTDAECAPHAASLRPVIDDARCGRPIIVVGYSGDNDHILSALKDVEAFDDRLYWVTYKDSEPGRLAREAVLGTDKYGFDIKGYDADDFFVLLAQKLECFPKFPGEPFAYLKEWFEQLTPYQFPGQDDTPDLMHEARKSISDAAKISDGTEAGDKVESSSEGAISATVIGANALMMAGDYEAVIKMISQFPEPRPESLTNIITWAHIMQGNALSTQAKTKSGEEADGLYRAAYEKYKAVVDIKPDMHEALNNWGAALSDQAKTKSGEEADGLYRAACEKYKAAVDIKPDMHDALYNWGVALSDQAKTKSGDEADDLYRAACEKYEAAVDIKPDMHDALYNWGTALLSQAKTKSGEVQVRLSGEARQKLLEAESLLSGSGAYNLACLAALEGDASECRQWLESSLAHGTLPDRAHIKVDTDIDSVRGEEWWPEFLAKAYGPPEE